MSASATVRRSSARNAAVAAVAAAPDNAAAPTVAAAPDAYPGALPTAETTVSAVSEQTDVPADRMAAQVKDAVTATLQTTLTEGDGAAPPKITADDVTKHQRECFNRAIGRAVTLATAENRTILDMARDIQEAIDAFKPLVPKSEWWSYRADTLDDFSRSYKVKMSGKTAEPYKWLSGLAVFTLSSEESRAIILTGHNGRPFPITTIDAIADWVVYTKADDTYAIKAGFENHLEALIARVADEG